MVPAVIGSGASAPGFPEPPEGITGRRRVGPRFRIFPGRGTAGQCRAVHGSRGWNESRGTGAVRPAGWRSASAAGAGGGRPGPPGCRGPRFRPPGSPRPPRRLPPPRSSRGASGRRAAAPAPSPPSTRVRTRSANPPGSGSRRSGSASGRSAAPGADGRAGTVFRGAGCRVRRERPANGAPPPPGAGHGAVRLSMALERHTLPGPRRRRAIRFRQLRRGRRAPGRAAERRRVVECRRDLVVGAAWNAVTGWGFWPAPSRRLWSGA